MIHFNPTIDLSCWWCRPLSKLSQGLSLSAYMCLCVCVCVCELFQSVSVISSTKDPAEIYKLVDWTIISTLDWWTRCHISIAFFEILKPSFVKTTSFKLAVATNEWQFFGAGPTCPWCELKALSCLLFDLMSPESHCPSFCIAHQEDLPFRYQQPDITIISKLRWYFGNFCAYIEWCPNIFGFLIKKENLPFQMSILSAFHIKRNYQFSTAIMRATWKISLLFFPNFRIICIRELIIIQIKMARWSFSVFIAVHYFILACMFK